MILMKICLSTEDTIFIFTIQSELYFLVLWLGHINKAEYSVKSVWLLQFTRQLVIATMLVSATIVVAANIVVTSAIYGSHSNCGSHSNQGSHSNFGTRRFLVITARLGPHQGDRQKVQVGKSL